LACVELSDLLDRESVPGQVLVHFAARIAGPLWLREQRSGNDKRRQDQLEHVRIIRSSSSAASILGSARRA
jgi:hypothetical protein